MKELLNLRHPFDKQHQAQMQLLRSLSEDQQAEGPYLQEPRFGSARWLHFNLGAKQQSLLNSSNGEIKI